MGHGLWGTRDALTVAPSLWSTGSGVVTHGMVAVPGGTETRDRTDVHHNLAKVDSYPLKHRKPHIFFFFFFNKKDTNLVFGHATGACWILVLLSGVKPCPLHWKPRVLTTRSPEVIITTSASDIYPPAPAPCRTGEKQQVLEHVPVTGAP